MKCTKSHNAGAQLLFCSLNLLFNDVLDAVFVVICLSSLLVYKGQLAQQKQSTCLIVSFTACLTSSSFQQQKIGFKDEFK